MRKIIPILALLALLAAGCSTTMIPVGANRAPHPLAVDLIVGQEFPHFNRHDPFTPVHVTFRNNTSHKVQLTYNQFTLIDPQGREFIIAPVRDVFDWLRYGRWDLFYERYYPRPVGNYVFREGRLMPGNEIQAVMFFHQATRFGQGIYTLVARIPENQQQLEFRFRLK